MSKTFTANEILNGLIGWSEDKIWASELAFFAGSRRIDFWTLEPAASQGFRACSYEIKISRSDFKRDSDEKQSGALMFADRFWYVTPPGLLRKDELPPWAGLQEWDGTKFAIIRRAPKLQKAEPTWELLVSILRNSGDCRRDIGLLKAQVAYYQFKEEREKLWKKHADGRTMERFMRRHGGVA
ncbi:MmcB family DNA repair protein [Agrobacterium rhizogenes]|nr:MmcB family DNA repair protein [Rhizobium rhizogenes]NTJ83351.1 MmcB family DNA repair protein [Rhizobium rhizogenes]